MLGTASAPEIVLLSCTQTHRPGRLISTCVAEQDTIRPCQTSLQACCLNSQTCCVKLNSDLLCAAGRGAGDAIRGGGGGVPDAGPVHLRCAGVQPGAHQGAQARVARHHGRDVQGAPPSCGSRVLGLCELVCLRQRLSAFCSSTATALESWRGSCAVKHVSSRCRCRATRTAMWCARTGISSTTSSPRRQSTSLAASTSGPALQSGR